MAGGHHRSVKIDPAIERWQEMHNTMYRRFRWTPNNTPGILFWGFGVPIFAFFAFAKTNNRWDFTGKGHDQSLLRVAPAAAKSASAEEDED